MPKPKPRTPAEDRDVSQQIVTRAPAGTKPPPATTGAPSAFSQARKPERAKAVPFNLAAVVIRDNVPIPPATQPGRASAYLQLLQRLKPGQCAELDPRHAQTLLSAGRKQGVQLISRPLPNGKRGIWLKPADAKA